MQDDDVVTVDDFDETMPKYQGRSTASGIYYRVPDPNKKVIWLDRDCGVYGIDPERAEELGWGLDNGDPVENAAWKRRNLLSFPATTTRFKPLH